MNRRLQICCGWRSPWCVLDRLSHALHINSRKLCDAHDARIWRAVGMPPDLAAPKPSS